MKKFLVAFFCVFSVVLNGSAESVMGVECQNVATGADGDYLLKCPMTTDLEVFKKQDVNSVFASVASQVNLVDLAAEQDVIYVNVIPDGCAQGVPAHRFLIRAEIGYYAYEACI
ncbi:MAG: hypothetical protein IJY99_04610 [Alphaproteobacteria bacterium]|nr:hypothetical protein [Alphaproteobacteria bacterium]